MTVCWWLDVKGQTHSGSREGEREVCGDQRQHRTGQDTSQAGKRRDLKPRQSVDSLLAWAVQAWARQQQKKRVRLGSAQLQAGGREGAPKVPRAPRGGVGWAAHGGCLGGWVRCWWAYVDSVGFALLSAPPWSPGRGSTGCVQMLPPAHLGAHTWAPSRLGCFNGPVGLAAWTRVQQQTGRRLGTVVQVLYQTWCTQPMVGWKPWK